MFAIELRTSFSGHVMRRRHRTVALRAASCSAGRVLGWPGDQRTTFGKQLDFVYPVNEPSAAISAAFPEGLRHLERSGIQLVCRHRQEKVGSSILNQSRHQSQASAAPLLYLV